MCQVHKEVLIHIPCNGHRMHVFEPVSQPGVDVPKMVYVSCFGSHTHPPPPPPNHTLQKMKMLEEEVDTDPFASSPVLRKRVEEKLLRQAVEGKRNGAAHVPIGSGGRKIRRLRERKRRVISEAEGLMALAVDQNFPYCRDIKIIGANIIVTCAHDDMLMHAAFCDRFAGDATFKTIIKPYKWQWYLYNIIAPARRDGENSKSIVVFRALMTGLATSDFSRNYFM